MKAIIYKENGIYKITTEENYNNQIKNAKQINILKDFESAEEIINYFIKYFQANKEDFIIIDN